MHGCTRPACSPRPPGPPAPTPLHLHLPHPPTHPPRHTHPPLQVPVGPETQAPELLQQLFRLGGSLLVERLPAILSGQARRQAWEQDEARATHAAKVPAVEGHKAAMEARRRAPWHACMHA